MLDMFLPRRAMAVNVTGATTSSTWKQRSRCGHLNHRQDQDRGWVVEGRIPWRDFLQMAPPEAIERWKFALCRYDYRIDTPQPELSTSAPLTKPSFHRYEDYASLRFVGPDERTQRPFGIDRRIPLTTSRVIGSPDPPLPYRVRRVYPKLKLTNPVTVIQEPGSDRLLVIVHQDADGASRVLRFRDDPDVDATETLLSVDRRPIASRFTQASTEWLSLSQQQGPPFWKSGREDADRTVHHGRVPLRSRSRFRTSHHRWPSNGHDGGGLSSAGRDALHYYG
jgi:hypothetical protein